MELDFGTLVLVSEDTTYLRERADHAARLLLFQRPKVFQPHGLNYMDQAALVLVQTETTYLRERADHGARLLQFQRPKTTAAIKRQLVQLHYQRPSPVLFEDKFVSVYPILEEYRQTAVPHAPQPFFVLGFKSSRIDDPFQEDAVHRIDHGLLFRYLSGTAHGAPTFMAITVDIPDFNDDPWLDPPRKPPSLDSQLFPFRQILQKQGPATSFAQLYYASPNFRIEAETDWRPPDLARDLLLMFRPIRVIQPIIIERVKATQVGFYLNQTRNIGDVFDILISDFADSTIDYIAGQIGRPLFGWMVVVAGNTPLLTNSPTPLTVANKPRTVL